MTSSSSSTSNAAEAQEELRTLADHRFTSAGKVDTLFPMTWMGRGMLNLSVGRMDQAKFFFDTTLKQCGKVLPALLGMAAVLFGEKNYQGAQDYYGKAISLYPTSSGAATRVGFGMACYMLGQVDRAKAAFQRALEMDENNVHGMVGSAILEMASLDVHSKDYKSRAEKAIKLLSMANLLDHSNAMVQNHLADHYFWKWTPLSGTVKVVSGSKVVEGSQLLSSSLDPGERIRIGTDFESYVAEEDDMEEEEDNDMKIVMRDAWEGASACKCE
jgi:RNA polymerase-associated protein CTR9